MHSAIRDNKKRGTVGEFLRDCVKTDAKLSVVSAYFTIYAYDRLRKELDSIDNLRFLFGEPSFLKRLDPSKDNQRNFTIEPTTSDIQLGTRLAQNAVARACYHWFKAKAEIKSMVRPNFLHGKLYHIQQANGREMAVAGSSNFTVNGLGLGNTPNIELNIIVDSDRDREDLKAWFDEVWNDQTGLVEDVKQQVLEYLEQLFVENDPEFVYFKTLFHLFGHFLDEQQKGGLLTERTGFFDSEIWNILYPFQKDGVKGAINKILRHNGCIIADSVGLGKTFEALAVIRYFELLNQRVLVLCPKKLSANWTIYQAHKNNELNPFAKDRFNYTVLYHTDLGRTTGKTDADNIDLENFNWGAYDLVVIDESHNFRGNPVERINEDGTTRMNRAKWLLERIMKSGVKTKVLLLSATPVNNNLRDLRNQIAIITEGRNNALADTTQIKDISQTLKSAQTLFTNWSDSKKNPQRDVRQLLEKLDASFFKLLDELTIARSRKHIKSFYDPSTVGHFPERRKPISLYPTIDTKGRFPTYDRLNQQILEYKLSVFNPSAYVMKGRQAKYEALAGKQVLNFKQSDREHFLIGMMKVNFLKRLESSIESFEVSMERTIEKIERLENKIDAFRKSGEASQLEDLDMLEPGEDELEENGDDLEQWQVGKKLRFDLADLELDRWLAHLSRDKQALIELYNNAVAVTPDRDAKLAELKCTIQDKIAKPLNEGNRKVILFTAFADTTTYLYKNIKDWVRNELNLHIALVAGSETRTTFGRNDFASILTNFSPVSKNRCKLKSMPQEGEIDIMIATDCISEGQNLQDADYLINYDIHWNPVRIIQRFGRIDRLGSKNQYIQLINFWPTKDLDNYINLKERVEARMALVDLTATADDNVLDTEQLEELITDDLKYRNKQLKQLQDEVLDLEDMDASVSLTDFTLDDFRIELLKFLENNRRRLEEAPLGLYAVVPAPGGKHHALLQGRVFSAPERDILKSGAVFCLRQLGNTTDNETVNPLQPYFLVYIREDGTVRFNYTNAKQVLEIYRLLCQGCTEPYEQLCRMFNTQTSNGENMAQYSDLLKQAIEAIARTFRKRAANQLLSGRGGALIPTTKQVSNSEQFELVTWLIIK